MHIEIVCCIKEQQKTKGKGIIIHKKTKTKNTVLQCESLNRVRTGRVCHNLAYM